MNVAAQTNKPAPIFIPLATLSAILAGAFIAFAQCSPVSAQAIPPSLLPVTPEANAPSSERFTWPSVSSNAAGITRAGTPSSIADQTNAAESAAERILRIASDPLLPLDVRRAIVVGEINGVMRQTRADDTKTTDAQQGVYRQLSRHYERMQQKAAQLSREQAALYTRINELSSELRYQQTLLAQLASAPKANAPAYLSPLTSNTDSAVANTAAWIPNDRHALPQRTPAVTPNPVPNLDELTSPRQHPARILSWHPEYGYRIMELPIRSESQSKRSAVGSNDTQHDDDLESTLDREIEILDRWLDSLHQQTESMRQRRQALDRRRMNLLEPVYQSEQNLVPLPPESIDQ